MMSLESFDDKISELNISADLSINRLNDFKSNLIKSTEDEHPHTIN